MAGLKKSKSDSGSPNIVLVIALIMFVLISIGLGVFAYYGYDGQLALKVQAKAAEDKARINKDLRDQDILARCLSMMAVGYELTPDDKTTCKNLLENFNANPDAPNFKDLKEEIIKLRDKFAAELKSFNAAEVKYETNYPAETKKAVEEAKKSRALLEATQKEYNDFKSSYDTLNARYEKDIKSMKDAIDKGNQEALAAAQKTNTKFPEVQKLSADLQADLKRREDEHVAELVDRDAQLARKRNEIAELEKKLSDRLAGVAPVSQGGGGVEHPLMLDISKGFPLWDRPLGKVLRVDPSNLQVYIDIGAKAGLKPDVSFNVFTTGPGGRADRQLRGTIEVVRVLNETSSLCRITSLYDEKGDSIALAGERNSARAAKAADNLIREGDLLFNMTFNMHVFIAGSVNFVGFNSDSPQTQNVQLQDFIEQLRKMNVVVDGYINMLNGQIEGSMTPKTRLLIRGDFAQLNSSPDEVNRATQIKEAYQVLKKQAVDQGMFIISAENFAAVCGYRSPQAQVNRDVATPFRPSLPWAGGARNQQRFDGGDLAPAVAPPPAEPKMEKQ